MGEAKAAVNVVASCGTSFLVDKEDYDRVSRHRWHTNHEGYVLRTVYIEKGRWEKVRLHRFLMNAPENKVVDHVNRDVLDNRKSNLRLASKMENVWNSGIRSTNTSGYKGVSYRKESKKWKAQINVNGKRVNLGHFESKHDAARMFNFWAKDLHGEFAWLNVIEEGGEI